MAHHLRSLALQGGTGTWPPRSCRFPKIQLTVAEKRRPFGQLGHTYDLTASTISPSIAPQKNMFFSRFSRSSWFVLAAALGSASCAGPKSPEGGPAIGAPEVAWRNKTHEQRQAYMAATVEPTMKRLFQSFNGKSYAGFGCDTCHGGDMDIVDFKMPNSLYALPEKDPVAEAMSVDEDTAKFMVEKVVPTFGKLLHETAGKGSEVGCFTCHQKE